MGYARELAELATAYNTGSPLTHRNKIINGGMVIDQRNAGAAITPTNGQYLVDRWTYGATQASKFTSGQGAGGAPVGFSNYYAFTSSSAYSLGAGDLFVFSQPIEGFNTADLNWGTANAKTVTLSFQVYSSLTGTFGGSIRNASATRSYPFSYSIPVANTWTTVSITIAGDTTGTWVGATNGIGMQVYFSLGTGATFSGTAGSWAAGNYVSATGATSVVGTNGATFYITGVQLEAGRVATPFEMRSYTIEDLLCKRYYWNSDYPSGGYYFSPTYNNSASSGSSRTGSVHFPVPMRTSSPSVSFTSPSYGNFSNLTIDTGGLTQSFFATYCTRTATGDSYWQVRSFNVNAEL